MNDDRPYIRGLERVEAFSGGGWMCVGCLPVVFAIGWSIYADRDWLILAILPAGVVLTLLAQVLFGTEVYTDAQGMRIGNRFRRRFIPWEQVSTGRTVTPPRGDPYIVIETTTGKVSLPSNVTSRPEMQASIWQHLNRYGKGDQIQLSEDAQSFWLPIPDNIPEEIDWESLTADEPEYGAELYELRRDYIRLVPIGASRVEETTIRWDHVNSSEWEDDDDGRFLSIDSRDPFRTLWISLEDDPNCRRFLLAVISRIRELEGVSPVHIPEALREGLG